MKKTILVIVIILFLLGISGVVLKFLPNEVTFKYFNKQGIIAKDQQNLEKSSRFFNQAEEYFSPWKIASKNNKLGLLYEGEKYAELKEKLQLILNKECSLSAKKIPLFCENIFYLAGINQYRLGEKLDIKEQKSYFEQAIYEFQKSLAINPDNTWAKENITFILENFEKKQAQKQPNPSDKDKKQDEENKKSSNKNSFEENKGNTDTDKSEKDENNGKELSSQDKQEQGADKQENNNQGNGENSAQKDEVAPSRLPESIKQALEQAQDKLEEDKNQQGFNRSKAAAEKDKQNINNPFDMFGNDPFFRNFFGNDPFFNPRENLTKTIANPDEKDW